MRSAEELFEEELRSSYDAEHRLARALSSMAKKVSNADLAGAVDELARAAKEQISGLEDVFDALDKEVGREEAGAVKGMVQDFTSVSRKRPDDALLDFHAVETVHNVAQYSMQAYETLIKLAERAGVNHTEPRVGDVLHAGMKQYRKAKRRAQKLSEKLIEQVQPA